MHQLHAVGQFRPPNGSVPLQRSHGAGTKETLAVVKQASGVNCVLVVNATWSMHVPHKKQRCLSSPDMPSAMQSSSLQVSALIATQH
jgi:hypothetical protein